jgi:hypothetical protein
MRIRAVLERSMAFACRDKPRLGSRQVFRTLRPAAAQRTLSIGGPRIVAALKKSTLCYEVTSKAGLRHRERTRRPSHSLDWFVAGLDLHSLAKPKRTDRRATLIAEPFRSAGVGHARSSSDRPMTDSILHALSLAFAMGKPVSALTLSPSLAKTPLRSAHPNAGRS